MSRISRAAMGVLAAGVIIGADFRVTYAANNDAQQLLSEADGIFKPLPKDMATPEFPITPERVDLGRKLFFDPRMSVDGTVSCSRCHQPSLYGTDGLPKSRGAHDKLNPR